MLVLRRIVGESMLPGLYPGSLVVGRRWLRRPRVGQVVIVMHDGKEKIKRVSRIDGSKLFVTGDNPAVSTDSRHFGWLSRHQIIAILIWPRTGRPITD